MKNKYIFRFQSNEAIYIYNFKVNDKNNTLLETAIKKIALIYNLAQKRNVYAYQSLIKIRENILQIINILQKEIKKYADVIKEHLQEANIKLDIPIKIQHQAFFTNPSQFSLMHALTLYDKLACLIITAKNLGAVTEQNVFFKVKNTNRKRLLNLLSNVAMQATKKIPNITIEQYCLNYRDFLRYFCSVYC